MTMKKNSERDKKLTDPGKGDFSCPPVLPASVPDNRFFSPFPCPEKIPTKRFSSPNSPLSPAELDELKECIEAANDLLRVLGTERDDENRTQLRLRFRSLRGTILRVTVACGEDREDITGGLQEVGQDFLQLVSIRQKSFVQFDRILSVHRLNTAQEEPIDFYSHKQELLQIEPALRRNLVLHFGAVVAGNPFLLNLWFGLPLHIHLLQFLKCEAAAKLDDGTTVRGILAGSEEGRIQIVKENELIQVNFDEICFITI